MANKIVTQARTWLGTKFHHQARVKGVGCDCIGLVVGVACELELKDKDGNLLSNFDERDYAKEPNGKRLQKVLDAYLRPIPLQKIKPGDVLLFRIQHDPQHVGIVSDYPEGKLGLIHCYAGTGKVVEHRLDDKWLRRVVSAYRFKKSAFK
nr:peptidase [bacterium]